MTKQIELVVEPDGHIRHLVDPVSESIGAAVGPKVETWRCSHVETWSSLSEAARNYARGPIAWEMYLKTGYGVSAKPRDCNQFWADLLPVGGPVLGPFPSHTEAIAAEIDWLQQHNLPTSNQNER